MTPIVSEISLVVDLVGIFDLKIVVYSESFMGKERITVSELSIGDIYWIHGIIRTNRNTWRSDIRISVCVISIHDICLWKIGSIR